MEKELVKEIERTADELVRVLDGFGQEVFNVAPFEGSWTPGQVAEHIYLSVSGILKAVQGNTGPTQRDPRQMVAPLREAFLNFAVKMKSPDFIIPSDEPKDQSSLVRSLKDTFAGLAETARTQDLFVTCLDFDMPTVGPITRVEWLNFAAVHTQRHIWQLKKMAAGGL